MSLITSKHKFEGIGKTGATGVFLWLSTSQPWLVKGLVGKIVYYLLTKFFSGAASAGLVMANIGVAKLETMMQQKDFDGSFDDAFKAINDKGTTLTKEEADAINEKVKAAARKFFDMSRNK